MTGCAESRGGSRDIAILRELARRYMDVCHKPVQQERRDLWRRHNSLKPTRPLIYVRAWAWKEMPQSRCECEDPFYREYEDFFRRRLFWDTLDDDSIFEPWVTVNAVKKLPPEGIWGLPVPKTYSDKGGFRWEPPIKKLEDAERLAVPSHVIDEEATAKKTARLRDAIGDIIPVVTDRSPAWRMWDADISTQLGYLRGIEQMMVDMVENPAWLHSLLARMRDGILKAQEEAEKAGDWRLCNHQNQAMPYAEELRDPAAESEPVRRSELWCFCASQETTAVGPDMFEEFMLQYQIPIVEKFGLVAYGCCEDLTRKIGKLKRIRNLRRIAVTPFADVARCAEQIGKDYVISYRPSPADMVAYGFNEERIKGILRNALSACRGLHVDITLKDVETVEGDENRVRNWVRLTRETIEEVWKD